MGRVKALLPHPDGSGRTLVRAAAETLSAAGLDPVLAVLGYARARIAPELRAVPGLRGVVNAAWRTGMLSSIQTGVREAAREGAAWALIAPVDQPFLSAQLVRQLLARAGEAPAPIAVVPATEELERAGRWGLPVLLSARLFPEVLDLRSPGASTGSAVDSGARRLLKRHRGDIAVVAATAQELMDLDTPRELARLLSRRPNTPPIGKALPTVGSLPGRLHAHTQAPPDDPETVPELSGGND